MTFLPETDSSINPNIEKAAKAHPFEKIIEKYHRFEYPLSNDHLNELVIELMESDALKKLKADLEMSPQLSALYRYDPFTMSESKTWAGTIPNGPKVAWLRVFHDLQIEDIYVTRTATEALVVINKPSIVVKAGSLGLRTQEPTVLFTSDMLKLSGYDIGELDTLGATFTHGNTPREVLPKGELMNHSVALSYYHFARLDKTTD